MLSRRLAQRLPTVTSGLGSFDQHDRVRQDVVRRTLTFIGR